MVDLELQATGADGAAPTKRIPAVVIRLLAELTYE
jgi:hypothetical protein